MGAMVSDLLLKSSQRRQIDAVADNQEIKNDFEFQQQMADLRVKKANARNAEEKAIYQRMENGLMDKYGERLRAAQTGAAESDEAKKAEEASIMGIIRRYKDQQEVADLANKRQQLKVMLEDEKLKRKEREHIVAMIREIDQNILESVARIEKIHSEKTSIDNENEITGDKAVQASRKLRYHLDNVPKDLKEALMRHPALKAYLNALVDVLLIQNKMLLSVCFCVIILKQIRVLWLRCSLSWTLCCLIVVLLVLMALRNN